MGLSDKAAVGTSHLIKTAQEPARSPWASEQAEIVAHHDDGSEFTQFVGACAGNR
jgi:hypothetical protein